jgi:hypothetical protein
MTVTVSMSRHALQSTGPVNQTRICLPYFTILPENMLLVNKNRLVVLELNVAVLALNTTRYYTLFASGRGEMAVERAIGQIVWRNRQ